jgi:hypothetical protein
LIAIANLFGVSIDYLVGLSETRQNIKQGYLANDELEYLCKYRQANQIEREKIKAYIDGLLSR